jgi:hypothetical protein
MVGMTTGRIIEPDEVATLTAFLASDHARSILGADYLIDGGAINASRSEVDGRGWAGHVRMILELAQRISHRTVLPTPA